ncbi:MULTISPECIES: DRTGG domain-containing protein [unclassified Virgibacillus]|uniref:DRTGG domain-containing protein n=1 Tax=unclassified Virgibacillus TaxID=2620237 RepID=UPI0024DECCAA|nr:DRTGG domain-containing protein [Virgibacillus sp. LDC-1]
MTTKHEQIIQHIISLEVGHKISVRQIAKALNVSEGTAYRAIKEAETQGLVSTIERVGTIRIERKRKENFERLTFAEVVNIVDGQVLGGKEGLHKTLNKFLIGAMQLDAMARYTEADSLLIVGNRVKAQELALQDGAAVLITGGFDTEGYIKQLADDKQLPIISTSYDTFTVAAMINRAIYDQLIKKEIVFVGDIFTPYDQSYYLHAKDQVGRWYELNAQSSHTRFPVLDDKSRVIGIVTSKDILGQDEAMAIDRVMTKNPIIVQAKTSLAYVAHMMVWEGIEVVPVVDQTNKLIGIVSRQDVLKALQQIQRQPQVGETIDDIVASNVQALEHSPMMYQTKVIPQMTNQLGTLSNGVFTSLITEASKRLLLYLKKGDLVVENLTVYFLKPVPIDSKLIIRPQLLDAGRIYAKIDVEVMHERKLVGKGLIMAQIIER